MSDTLLEIRHLNIEFHDHDKPESVVNDFNLTLQQGEIVGIVGESGSGKSTLARAILGMLPDCEGEIIHHSKRPQMVFQDPASAMNPSRTVE